MSATKAPPDSKVKVPKENSFNGKEFLEAVNETEKEVEDESHNESQAKVRAMKSVSKMSLVLIYLNCFYGICGC